MIHPATELRQVSDDIGHGVFATAFIPRGTLVYVRDDLELLFPPGDRRVQDPRYADLIETYCYLAPDGTNILSWDHARFVNHSCDPNTMSTGYNFEVALRDIEPGEQITDEYGLFNMAYPLNCQCGWSSCRGRITADDPDLYADIWDEQLKAAMVYTLAVEQPLMKYIDVVTRRSLTRYLKTGKGYRSCRALRYRHEPIAMAV